MENISDIYELSPMQQGMLFHTLYAPASGVYFEQLSCSVHGKLNIPAFERAWQQVVARHPALRTSFYWEEIDKLLQVVHERVDLPWENHDWRELSSIDRTTQLATFRQADINSGFDLHQPPLMRCALIRMTEDTSQFIWSHHHILMDGWCLSIIFKEVLSCYEARLQDENCHLPTPIPYRAYIDWLNDRDRTASTEFWRQNLQAFSAPTPLVVGLTPDRSQQSDSNYHELELRLSTAVSSKLQALAQQQHITLSTIIQAAWGLLLSRYSGEPDILFGVTVSGRPASLAGVENMVGLFINTLPLRLQISSDQQLIPWFKHIQQLMLELQQYSYTSLVEIQSLSEVPKGTPLFESIVVFENYPMDSSLSLATETGSLQLSEIESHAQTNYPLTVSAEPGDELLVKISYDSVRFAEDTIERMLGHLQMIFLAIAENPQQSVSELPLLAPLERQQLLVEWNNTQQEYPQDKCIHQLIEAQVERNPCRIAAVFEDKRLTYLDVNHKANQLACLLQKNGVGQGKYVPVLMDKSLELLLAHLAIMKVGAAFVPMDPKWPIERIKEILDELDSEVVLVDSTQPHGDRLANWSCLVVDEQQLTDITPNLSNVTVNSDDPIYVIFTSGSTGKPKGAINLHRGIINRFFNMNDRYGCKENDVILFTSNHVFDSSVWQLFWPLINGSRTIIAPPSFGFDLDLIITLIDKEKVTITDFVPSVFNILVDYIVNNQELCCKLHSLRQLLIGGEAMSAKSIYQFKSYFPLIGITNTYGPTETSIGVIFHEVPAEFTEPIPIGRPLHNVYALILDKNLNPVPIGVSGELYLGGACVGRGYLNNETATNAVFIPNPFAEVNSKLLYKTGDLVRYLPDSTIDFLGRIDTQVKIRGIRIELGEIESLLAQHPDVRRSVVIAREDNPGTKYLVAYVVPNRDRVTTSQELRQFLKEKLPEYTIPSTFVVLESLPLTSNGKIDWQALPVPDVSRIDVETSFVPPHTPTEETLATIWADILGRDRVGIHDNFFELGGDSIQSIQVVARANQAGLSLTPKLLFQHQTIARLAAVASTTLPVQAEQGTIVGQVPLTPIQHWFFTQNLPEPHHYNQSRLLEVLPNLNPALLDRAIRQLLVHHDALRLRFTFENIWQQVNSAVDENAAVLTVTDLSKLSASEQRSQMEAAAEELQASLTLSDGQIIRVVLFQLGNDLPSRLLLIIHHLAVDGVSWRILLEDLATAYQQLSQGEVIRLPTKTTAFKDWADRLLEYGQSERIAAEWDYWLAQSRTVAPLPIDYPFAQKANSFDSMAQVSVTLSVEQTQALLQEVPSVYNTQINDVLLTALVRTFFQWTGQRCLLVDLEGHGREDLFQDIDPSRTVGWFTTVFPVRLEMGKIEHLGELLKSIKEQLRRLPNQGIGYGILRYLSQDGIKQSQMAALPQAEISFNYLGQFDPLISKSPLLGLARESCGQNYSRKGNLSYQLEIDGFVEAGKLQLNWTYSENIYQRVTIECLAQDFVKALIDAIEHCQSAEAGSFTPSDFPEAELNQQDLDRLTAKLNTSQN